MVLSRLVPIPVGCCCAPPAFADRSIAFHGISWGLDWTGLDWTGDMGGVYTLAYIPHYLACVVSIRSQLSSACARCVKCDETPGKGGNCTSTGGPCEGYEVYRLPLPGGPKTKRGEDPLLTSAAACRFRWVVTSDERRCFAFFCDRMIRDAVAFRDSARWPRMVLDIANTDPVVCHAVIALGAAHQETVAGSMQSQLALTARPTSWHWVASAQLAQAFALLRRRNPHDPQLREVMVLCCLLFVLISLILTPTGLRQCHPAPPEWSPHREGTGSPHQPDPVATPDALEPLHREVLHLMLRGWGSSAEIIATHYEALHAAQPALLSKATQTQASFAGVQAMHYRTLSFKEQRGADITEWLLRTHSLGLRTCLLKNDPARPKPFTPEYATHFPEKPSLLVDLGVILALYHPVEACQDFTVRWRALQALRSWPHNEGAFDSLVVLTVFLLESDVGPKEFDAMVNRQVEDQLRLITGNEDRELAQAGAYLTHSIDSDHSMKAWTCVGRLLNLKA
ncbi:hypothetical protein BO82DRAFT_401990 [Aspergillus uvarum CBS 121591]|uniref:C6 zinc finger domain protein n=1 Tax=Aspergillus uvarum CBS 121591 TaxID=1448315 RepID=A0A319CSM7_9EURO|nr:hypothetical protein BO82DRAFT_401990 [Aspergillus uvarum CBS 121591]PYH81763.1 hypothetical protein BO82DRAFT_401990 [Aspergillus uvarum CBS 121591]